MAAEDKVRLEKPPARVVVQVHGWYPIVVLVMVFVVATGLNIMFTLYVDNERKQSERKAQAAAQVAARKQSCQLVVAFDELYKETPPQTPAGQNVAALWAEYRRTLGC
jgi:hypothetical protein